MSEIFTPGTGMKYVDNMPNEVYHNPANGFSSSNVKAILEDPALIQWNQAADQDESKMDAIDFGTHFHSYFLEPDIFRRSYKVLPEFNRRKPAEKQEELDLMYAWKLNGITAVKAEDMQKLEAMRQSALAHPTVAAIMALKGVAERSYFWIDESTGVYCKCRPDWIVLNINDKTRLPFMNDDQTTLVMDVKTIARIDRIPTQVEDLKYFVQDPFYTMGIETVTRTEVCFAFAFVSTSISLGRYPVKVVVLDEFARMDGLSMVRDALSTYSGLVAEDCDAAWQTVRFIGRPNWAKRGYSGVSNLEDLMA